MLVNITTERDGLDLEEAHDYERYIEEFTSETKLKVYGITKREGAYFFFLFPYSDAPMDLFFVKDRICQVLEEDLPLEWGSEPTFTQLKSSGLNDFDLISYPIFLSTTDFVWRMLEGDLSVKEKSEVIGLLR